MSQVEGLLRELAPQVLGFLARRYGQFDLCEDAVQEALLAAATQWPDDGVPANPRGWLITVATRRLTDQFRSESARRRREDTVAAMAGPEELVAPGADVDSPPDADDTLTLLFLCCHPAVTPASQVALTLRAVGGLTTAEIARAFMVPEATMAPRISRAKKSIKAAGSRFVMPPEDERADRLRVVLQVLYLIFNEGYTASSGEELQRVELTAEAIRLARMLRSALPDDGEVAGLLALMLLTDSRRRARTTADGGLVPIDDQDRTLWDREQIEEGAALILQHPGARCCRSVPAPGGDRGDPCRGAERRGDRLAADPVVVPAAREAHAEPDGDAQPRNRTRPGRGTAGRARSAGHARR